MNLLKNMVVFLISFLNKIQFLTVHDKKGKFFCLFGLNLSLRMIDVYGKEKYFIGYTKQKKIKER